MRLKCVCAVVLVALLGACGLEEAAETRAIQSDLGAKVSKPVDNRSEKEAREIQETRRARRPFSPMSQMQGPPPGARKLDPIQDQKKLELLNRIMSDQMVGDSSHLTKIPLDNQN